MHNRYDDEVGFLTCEEEDAERDREEARQATAPTPNCYRDAETGFCNLCDARTASECGICRQLSEQDAAPFDNQLTGRTLDSEIAALLPTDDVLPPMRGRAALIADLRALLDPERPPKYQKGVVR